MLKKIAPLFFTLFFALRVTAHTADATGTRPILKAAADITQENYPNADLVVVDENIQAVYQSDGTFYTLDDEYVKILTEKGKRSYQNISSYFTLPYGSTAIPLIEIISPDGTVSPVNIEQNSRVMVNPSQMNANIYNPNSKILQVSVTGLNINDIIHVISSNQTVKARVPETWSDIEVLEYTSPIRHLVINVDGPKELPLKKIRLRDEVPGTVKFSQPSPADGRIKYRWEITDVPRMFPEPKMPKLYTVVQRLLVSTISSWEDISRWYWNLSESHINDVTPQMREKVAELTKGCDSRDAKIRAIFKFVSQQIRYMGITTEKTAPGYEPHDVSLTFNNRYGVCRDKAALLVAMLRTAGLSAYPVLINVGPLKDPDVPQPYFNHAIAAVENQDGSYTLMDATDENTTELMPAYLSYMSYLVARPDGEKLLTSPVVPASRNTLNITTTGTLSGNGLLKLTSKIDFKGINDNAYRGAFLRMKPEERRRLFESKLKQRIAGAKLTAYSISPEDMQDTASLLTVTLSYEAPDYPICGDSHTILTPPWLNTTFGYANFLFGETGLKTRKYPYYTRVTAAVNESINIRLNNMDFSQASTPEPTELNAVDLTYQQNSTISNNTLECHADFSVNRVIFSPKQYIKLKQFLKDREYEQRKTIILETADKKSTENDIRIVSDDTSVTITDTTNWTVVSSITKKVLTYAGKKDNSELKIGYNPAWESVRLVSAKVENPDGSSHTVVNNEMNLMDASWSGSAPRYPAAKTLVISLPGVEKGSIISYSIERKSHGKPFFSYMKTFRGDNPVDSASISITTPRALTLTSMLTSQTITATTNASANSITYTWKTADQPAIKPEEQLPPSWTFLPTLIVSAGNWTSYSHKLSSRLEKAASNSTKCAIEVLSIVEDCNTISEKVTAIRNYVASNIRLAGPGLNSLPLSAISNADTVLAEGYGNTTDKAVLIASMLRTLGIQADFVAASSWAPVTQSLSEPLTNYPLRGLFDTVLVKVRDNDGDIYISGNNQYAALGASSFDGKPALSMNGAVTRVTVPSDRQNSSSINFDITLQNNGNARIKVMREYRGTSFGQANRMYSELPPEELRRHFMQLVASLSQSATPVGGLNIDFTSYPGKRSFTVDIPRYAVRSGKFLYLRLPSASLPGIPLASDTREQPIYFNRPVHARASYTIHAPAETTAIPILPPAIDWHGPAGLGSINYSCTTKTNQTITIKRQIDLNPAIVLPEMYPALLDINRRLKHPANRTMLFELR